MQGNFEIVLFFTYICKEWFTLICRVHPKLDPFNFTEPVVQDMLEPALHTTYFTKELNLSYTRLSIESILNCATSMVFLERIYLSGNIFLNGQSTLERLTKNLPNLRVLWLNRTNISGIDIRIGYSIALSNVDSSG